MLVDAQTKKNNGGKTPVSASPILCDVEGKFEEPEELSKEGIEEIVNQFINSMKITKEAGFDGVEFLGANGFLIDGFLRDSSNQRKDEFGGSVENRSRFPLRLIDEAVKIFGNKGVGIKVSPLNSLYKQRDSDPEKLIKYFFSELNKRNILFVEFVRPSRPEEDQLPEMKEFKGLKTLLPDVLLIGNLGMNADEAEKLIQEKAIDLVSFATLFIANPDLGERIRNGWELAQPNWGTMFGADVVGKDSGYSDYPAYDK